MNNADTDTLEQQLHRLGNLVVARDPSAAAIGQVVELIAEAAAILGDERERTLDEFSASFANGMLQEVPEGPMDMFITSPYSGKHNPLAPADYQLFREGDKARALVTLGVAFQGAPARSHGGVVAGLFDDIMGSLQMVIPPFGYTRSLTVNYVRPFPIDEQVELVAEASDEDDHTFTVVATATYNAKTVATAEATFTKVNVGQFAPQTTTSDIRQND